MIDTRVFGYLYNIFIQLYDIYDQVDLFILFFLYV